MNVKELWAYSDALKNLRRAEENLEEYESILYSPGGARAGGMPFEKTGDSPDRLAPMAEEHDKLLRRRDECKLRCHEAFRMLEAFETILSEEEREVLRLRYRKGMTCRDVGIELHMCERTVRRINIRIKEKFRKF